MTNSTVYWLWLQQRLGVASRFIGAVLEQPGTARFIYECTEDALWALGRFPSSVVKRLLDKSLDGAYRVMYNCENLSQLIITPDDDEYPERLLEIIDPPAVLYASGTLPDIDRTLCVGVVGTRSATAGGQYVAQTLASDLVRSGCIVISGAARGIDQAAHNGALLGRGTTVAVLGCGIDYRYNRECESLRELISHRGALISEYPPGTPPSKITFPIRNRIISGLSVAVVVVEAGANSGSINTANTALEQSRDVFAVPASVGSPNSEGVINLLRDGASRLECTNDLLMQYSVSFNGRMQISEACSLPLIRERRRISSGKTLSDSYCASAVRYRGIWNSHYNPRNSARVFAGEEQHVSPVPTLDDDLYASLFIEEEVTLSPRQNVRTVKPPLVDELYGSFLPRWQVPFPNGIPGAKKKAAQVDPEQDEQIPTSVEPDDCESQAAPIPVEISAHAGADAALDDELSDNARRLLSFITSEPKTSDELSALSGIQYSLIPPLLTELELSGAVCSQMGKRYKLNDDN